MKPYEMLKESIEFANNQLNSFIATKDLNDITTIVITALYRKIIELSEGVKVSAANGLAGPAEINYRGLIEASLAFEYILQNSAKVDDRAKAYKIGYHKQQISAVNQENLSEQAREFINRGLNYHQQELELEELQEVLLEFDELQSRDSRGFIPKWYSLDGGPKSINKLALRLAERRGESENLNLVSELYGLLSTGAHIYMALNSVIKVGDDISIKQVRANFNSNLDEYNFVGTRGLLTSAINKFTKTKHPEFTHEKNAFFTKIRPHLKY
ncbi:DUF5677 domain-containing protein [Viridibacillus sp. FSL R5-0468]|uniref:DUF5677 domain-containing protein n=1 Tax=Viridibacillus sp. FSL R5-0468 TaxID=2921640 RepID=UPI0030FABF4A